MLTHEAFLEAELFSAARTLTNHLFHYTTAEAAIFGILRSGTLRLSPFESTNDLWESRPLHPNLSSHRDDLDPGSGLEVWNDLDKVIRKHAKVVCLTQDWSLPDTVANRDAFRGWNHLATWAHYGAGHAGICLRFDRDKLIAAFSQVAVPDALLRFHGPVEYRRASIGAGPHGVDLGQILEFGLDAVAINYADVHRDQIFFRKHADWSNESEYRLVLVDQSVLPVEVPIRAALTGVFLGDAFPDSRLPALMATLKKYPDVEVLKLVYHNRHLACMPFDAVAAVEASTAPSFANPPRRSGSLSERLNELKESVRSAEEERARAVTICSPLLDQVKSAVGEIGMAMRSWPNVEVGEHTSVAAIPEHQRSRAPGVPGERIHFESGYMCVVENLPKYTHTLVAAGAIQVLDDDQVRVHALIATERWKPNGNEHAEHWRECCVTPLVDAVTALDSVLAKLHSALETTRQAFDRDRSL
ncbi:DUF2971 domain-containing protein [Micromonospora sp. NPDC047644]|uniref:DUF2971 domain-containing protein n=1 Tax=Micromonospora sp. NPDC047644 TaxID=3157203 RepID=UPI003451E68F